MGVGILGILIADPPLRGLLIYEVSSSTIPAECIFECYSVLLSVIV